MHSHQRVLAFALAIASALTLSPRRIAAEEPLPQVERLQSSPVLRHLRPAPHSAPQGSPATDTLARMYVPEGFRVDLVAAEPEVRQPVAFAIDERGRLWVAEAFSYPTRRPEGEGLDRLIILQDTNGDGRFESRKVFAEGLNLVSGFELGFGGVWVGAAPHLLFIPDLNHDDVPDTAPQILLEGFGYQDTHECLNSFHWGPDGWLYGIQGVFNFARIGKPGAPDNTRLELRAGVWRYHPLRHEFEIFAHGGSNPWGLDHDPHGQLFMSHCRSYWGRGGITHVIQGGQFWNQANANYAPFILPYPPAEFPDLQNFLLASARHDHGAGGAGLPGTDAIFGGHSHVGTMIYLGDNWPDEYRGRLFTHNLHGHQINQDINLRSGSGYDTVHASGDVFFCADPRYVAVDLQYGPDGAVYSIDWYDQQHCHNPNTERWERGNGRIYRMAFAASYQPVSVNLRAQTDAALVHLLSHKNAWFERTARRLLQERAAQRPIEPAALATLAALRTANPDPELRLRALWTTHAIRALSPDLLRTSLADPDEFIRAWAVQLAAEQPAPATSLHSQFLHLAQTDPSPVVRRYLASAIQRLPDPQAWPLLESLARHAEDLEDRNLPRLLWHSLAPRIPRNLPRALALAQATPLTPIADWTYWFAATLDSQGISAALRALDGLDDLTLRRRLAGLWLALEPRANLPMPEDWKSLSARLATHPDERIRRQAERIGAAFGDTSLLPRLRQILANTNAPRPDRDHALAVLGRVQDPATLPILIGLLDDRPFRSAALGLLARYDSPQVASAILERLADLDTRDRNAALQTLTRRASFALALLDAVAEGRVSRDQLTAYHIRQMTELRHPEVLQRIERAWGRIQPSAKEKQDFIGQLRVTFDEAPLWAYDARAGREHFLKLCASCHVLGKDGARIGPDLTGAGRNGIGYYLENVIDPNAVVGADFQLTTVETRDGEVVSGLKLGETDSALTLRTTTDQIVIPKANLVSQSLGTSSLMPEGFLEALGPRERLELLKFLIEN